MVKRLFINILVGSIMSMTPLFAQTAYDLKNMQTEHLDRALVAINTSKGNYLSWRWLPTDPEGYRFRLYRNGKLVGELTKTNLLDSSRSTTTTYKIVVVDAQGNIIDESETVTPWDKAYKTIHLNRPASDTAKAGKISYTYYPSDMGVADADGDGKMEFLIKWQPTLVTDNMSGYTGKCIFSCYKMDGTELWTLNLGSGVRTGEHINQFLFYDLDGDGKAEFICKTGPGSKDGKGNYVSEAATDASIRNTNNEMNCLYGNGLVCKGAEFLTVFNGETGAAIHTIYYNPNREGGYGEPTTTGSGFKNNYFGDTFGNRADRFLAAVAYLNGKTPSAVFTRGYYAAAAIWAVNFDGKELSTYWFRKDTKKKDEQGNYTAYGQGFHNLAVADVDGDGADEIIFGSATIDHDGSILHSSGLGHGDAVHVGDFDPTRPGLEIYGVHEASPFGYTLQDGKTGEIIHRKTAEGDTGRGLIADIDPKHPGAEMWDSSRKGSVYDINGDSISGNKPSYNFRIYWDGDLQDELLGDVAGHNSPYLEKWDSMNKKAARLLIGNKNIYQIASSKSDHSSKGTPAFQGDILGDWREEMIFMNSSDSASINIFSTTITTDYRVPCLLSDHVYRMGTVWQNVGYNQPPYLGYWLPNKAVKDTGRLSTGIQTIKETEGMKKKAPSYNILGQAIDKRYKGFIIQNGKKWVSQ